MLFFTFLHLISYAHWSFTKYVAGSWKEIFLWNIDQMIPMLTELCIERMLKAWENHSREPNLKALSIGNTHQSWATCFKKAAIWKPVRTPKEQHVPNCARLQPLYLLYLEGVRLALHMMVLLGGGRTFQSWGHWELLGHCKHVLQEGCEILPHPSFVLSGCGTV